VSKKNYLKRYAINAFVSAVVLVLGARAYASVTVAVNLGANWVGTPTIMTGNGPSTNFTSIESNWGSGAPYSLGQTFVATVSGVLTNIQMYFEGKGVTNVPCLYDMGPYIQFQPTNPPGSIVPGSNGVSGNLLSTNLSAYVTSMSNPSVIQFTFAGADAVQITGGHEYYYAMVAQSSGQYWYQNGGSPADIYPQGAAYSQNSLDDSSKTKNFGLAVTLVNTSAPPTIYDCVVDWNNVHQRIDGFGACSAWQSTWTTSEANMFFSTNSGTGVSVDGKTNFPFNGISLSLLRSRIAPGGTTVENSIMQMAQARGARVWSTPWSPAVQFKSNDNVNGGDFLSASNQAYANQLAGYVVNMKNTYGINLYAISVQNEPDVSASYESCIWTAAQFDQFVPYLANALVASNVASTKIIVAEDEHWETNYYATTMMDPTAAPDVGIVACHDYSGSPPNDIPGVLPLYDNTNAAEWETETSELSGNGAFNGSITDAMYWAGRIQLFMAGANANAFHYWWLMSGNPDNEGLTDTNGIPAQRMYVLGQYSRFVRPNNYRIDLANYNSYSVLGTAYKDPVSGNFAIVMVNTNTAATTQSFDLTNFTATTVTPWITSSNLSLAVQSPVTVSNSSFSYLIPGMSVVTFVGTMTVNSQTLGISILPTASAISYGQTLASSTLSGGTATNAAGSTVGGNFAFTTPSTMPGVGTAVESVTFTPTDTTDYTTATTNVSVTVNPQTPLISILPTASAITNGQTLASSTLSGGAATNAAGATLSGNFAFTTPSTEPRAGTPSELVTFTPTDTTDYSTATTPIYVTVYPQTPLISILPTASAITYGQTLANSTLSGGTVTNASGAPVNGNFAFASPSTAPGAGTPGELVTFTPIDNTDNTTVTTNVQVTVNQATPVISSAPTASAITYGQTLASSTLSGGTASAAGAFAFTTPSTAPAAGTPGEPVTFTPTDTTDYSTATTSVSVTVNTVSLSITVNNTNKVYGQTLTFAGTEFTTSGLTNSDSVTSVTLASAGATNTAPVNGSPYSITASGAVGSGLNNYNITYYPGSLTVGPAVLGVTADNQSQLYGATNPVLTATFSGFVNGESLTNSDVVGVPQLSTLADTNSPVGTYVISISLGSLASTNYTFSLTNGTLTVAAPELTIVNAGATGFELTFPTSPGQMYQIECTTNLNDAVWTPLGDPIPGTGGSVSITNDSGACQCFYLLQIWQQ
jgi:O-glycosyl hydrolase